MATKSRTLEFTILSAEGLHVRGKPADKNVFVVVSAESIIRHTTRMTDGDNGSHWWNDKLSVELGEHARCLTIEVKFKTGAGVKDVGVARIALSDFLAGSLPHHSLQSFSYRLRDWDGRENGVVNFSVRVVTPQMDPENDSPSSSDGAVTGIPVWFDNSTTSTSNSATI